MNSIRARIAAILIVSISCVICVVTATTFVIVRRAADQNFIRPIADELDLVARLAAALPSDSTAAAFLTATPKTGEPRERLTALFRRRFADLGAHPAIIVTRPPGEQPYASIEVAPQRWLAVPVPEQAPPPEVWLVLSGWMLLILLGTGGISLVVAQRVTRPLVLLESFAAGIGPNGELQTVPETGPAEVRATARALNRLSSKLRQAIESRMRLVASAGHDLRTPLTRMRLRAEFLDDAERGKWLQNIDELERIADSAILLVREEIGGRDREAVRLDRLVHAIADELKAVKLPVAIVSLAEVTVIGPPLALTRALRNLIVNAARHGGGAAIAVEDRRGAAVLFIDDHGPGIPEHLLDRVFEPFFRVDQSRRQTVPGAGLGLAIAHEILGRAGAVLTLSNRSDGGLRQEVVFQKSTAPRPGAKIGGSTRQAQRRSCDSD